MLFFDIPLSNSFLIFRPGKSYLSFLGIRLLIGKLRPDISFYMGTAHNSNLNCNFKQPLLYGWNASYPYTTLSKQAQGYASNFFKTLMYALNDILHSLCLALRGSIFILGPLEEGLFQLFHLKRVGVVFKKGGLI